MRRQFAKLSPFTLSFVAFALIVWQEPWLVEQLSTKTDTWSNLYTAIFDWSAIQTGFLFGVYGFVVGTPNAFMKAIESQRAFRQFKRSVLVSLTVGFFLTLTALPLLVFAVNPFDLSRPWSWAIYAWLSVFVFALVSFFGAAYLFAYMTRQSGNQKIDG